MKKFLTFVFALSIVFYLSNVSIAQGRGTGQGPAVSSAHIPDTSHSSSDHGKSADHANTTHDSTSNQQRLIDRINTDTKFNARLTALLPMGNTLSLVDLASKFKNQGLMIAFLHVGQNLKLKLDDWNKLLDATTADGGSLGKGIKSLDLHLTETQINVQVQTAEKQAKQDLKTTS
jgi:hypothetical protein